jgi:acyl-CoA reductase-like NAD-dependent aldehyde dehydrogenase
VDDREVQAILQRVRERMGEPGAEAKPGPTLRAVPRGGERLGDGVFATVDEAVNAARSAYEAYISMGLERRYAIVDSIRRSMRRHAEPLARMAHEETGLGRWRDKLKKNLLVTEKTPGPEDLEPRTVTGDTGLMITEYAPYGVFASITPTTNPTSTIINNTIGIVSAGNSVVFNVHPNAKRVSMENIRLLHRAIVEAGGPPNLITGVAEPTLETAHEIMHHPKVRILLVTGGPAVVQVALATNKKAITAGPGNPPVVVDETANIDRAGRDIVLGASFDNNLICTDEKEVFVVSSVADDLVRSMAKHGAVVLRDHQLRKLERVLFEELGAPGKPGRINRKWIGRNAGVILGEIGIAAGEEVRLVVAEVPIEHSLVWTEQMMPVMPVARVRDVDQAIELAVKAEHGFGHTASIHSENVDAITRMARAINASIFVANAPNYSGLGAGGEGYTSFSIASPTGEGLTRARTFSRERRMSVVGALRIV